jgi:hypothetical protein
MPIHDWKRADIGWFHHFRQSWACELCNELNAGVLPDGYFALIEQKAIGLEPDILTLTLGSRPTPAPAADPAGGLAVATAPPKTRFVAEESDARKANRLGVRNRVGELAAIIEIVSPGNKSSRHGIKAFVDKTVEFLDRGVHVLVIDLFPPTPRDPDGIHKVIWDEFHDEPFALPPEKPLVLAAYCAARPRKAYVEPVAVGDPLPPMPVFLLDQFTYVPAPLEETYTRTWEKCPRAMREAVERGTGGDSTN